MGLGKTFTGAEKLKRLGGRINLIVCQKSKIDDWVDHFVNVLNLGNNTFDLTTKLGLNAFVWEARAEEFKIDPIIGIINYDLIIRRPELQTIKFDTLMLDESSQIKNDTAKRTKAILKFKTLNVILLSGTPTGGKYEELYSQMKLLGWNITKTQYWYDFIKTKKINIGGFSIPIVTGYKNVGRLKRKMREYGCDFLKTDEVFDLPPQTFTDVKVDAPPEYKKFAKSKIVEVHDRLFVGDTVLTELLYLRQLCGAYAPEKIKALADIIESTNDRLIIFYNFNNELEEIKKICRELKRPFSQVNGTEKDLSAYEQVVASVTAIQYQAGACGLNLQLANKMIYFSPPLSSELYEQSKKRIHRLKQTRPCFYYRLICKNSVETKIYEVLETRHDYTEALFKKGGF